MRSGIKVLFSDSDGTLADGKLYFSEHGEALKVFHVHDGMGIKLWQKSGRVFGIVTARNSSILKNRADELKISPLAMGIANKLEWVSRWLDKNGFSWDELAYIGDDLNDLEVLKRAGVSACPADALKKIQSTVDRVCIQRGGEGAVREFIDELLLET